jgi:hypothetical protein
MSDQHDKTEPALKWDMREQIVFPSPDRERRLLIRTADWKRIKDCASEAAGSSRGWLLMVASALYGIGATAGLSMIPLAGVREVAPWIMPLYACIAFFSLLTAVVFTAVDCRSRSQEKRWAERLKQDMLDIESLFPTPAVESEGVQLRAETAMPGEGVGT